MKEFLKIEVGGMKTALSNYLISGPKSIQQFEIDCSKLDERFFREDIRHSEEFKDIFKSLADIQDYPCLYIFEIESETSTNSIIDSFKNFGNQSEKVIPKLNVISNFACTIFGNVECTETGNVACT